MAVNITNNITSEIQIHRLTDEHYTSQSCTYGVIVIISLFMALRFIVIKKNTTLAIGNIFLALHGLLFLPVFMLTMIELDYDLSILIYQLSKIGMYSALAPGVFIILVSIQSILRTNVLPKLFKDPKMIMLAIGGNCFIQFGRLINKSSGISHQFMWSYSDHNGSFNFTSVTDIYSAVVFIVIGALWIKLAFVLRHKIDEINITFAMATKLWRLTIGVGIVLFLHAFLYMLLEAELPGTQWLHNKLTGNTNSIGNAKVFLTLALIIQLLIIQMTSTIRIMQTNQSDRHHDNQMTNPSWLFNQNQKNKNENILAAPPTYNETLQNNSYGMQMNQQPNWP